MKIAVVRAIGVVGFGLLALTGCQTASYYSQAVRGHTQIVARQRPIAELLKQPDVPESLKTKLRSVIALREFAAHELQLPVARHYQRYADLERRYVVWNVTAAPEFSLQAKAWWYPVVGRLTYRGYFKETAAKRCAEELKQAGFDVDVGGVRAYSTLGWFSDPVLNTFVNEPETELAAILFHELGHQRLFVSGDTDFNEAFAEAIAEEGTQRWLRAHGTAVEQQAYRASLRRKEDFTRLVTETRAQLAQLYEHAGTASQTKVLSPENAAALREQKEKIFNSLKQNYASLKATWRGHGDYERWFSRPLNNAHLNDVDTYYHLVAAFHQLLRECHDDLSAFHRAAATLAKLPKPERHRQLEELLTRAATTTAQSSGL